MIKVTQCLAYAEYQCISPGKLKCLINLLELRVLGALVYILGAADLGCVGELKAFQS